MQKYHTYSIPKSDTNWKIELVECWIINEIDWMRFLENEHCIWIELHNSTIDCIINGIGQIYFHIIRNELGTYIPVLCTKQKISKIG